MRKLRWTLNALVLVVVLGVLGTNSYLAARDERARGKVLGRGADASGVQTVELLSGTYTLDQPFESMHGPMSVLDGFVLDREASPDDILWIKGITTDLVDADTLATLEPPEFFCHSNLTFNPQTTSPTQHNAAFSPTTHMGWRLFTLVPGMMDMQFPKGFGIPVQAGTRLDYLTMALNLNHKQGTPGREIKMRSRVRYLRDDYEDGKPLKPLLRRALYVYQQHKLTPEQAEAHPVAEKPAPSETPKTLVPNPKNPDPNHPGQSCGFSGPKKMTHPGAACCVANASEGGVLAEFGAENTIHWFVPPGKHTYRVDVSTQLKLPFDTLAHYITGHLHPFGKSMKLVDLDADQTIAEIRSEDYGDRRGVKNMTQVKSGSGIPLRQDGRYELIAEYDNTSDAPIDAMAILYIYAVDNPTESVADNTPNAAPPSHP